MREKILEILESGGFISGEILAEKLNVSRTAIWKQIKVLRDLGYEIESVKNKGYRLVLKPDIPLPEEIKNGLDTKIIGKKIIYFKTIDSTNSYCKNLVREGIVEGTVVVADIPTAWLARRQPFRLFQEQALSSLARCSQASYLGRARIA